MSNEAQQPLETQLLEARKLWYEKYQTMSGLPTSLPGRDQIPFGAHADLLIKQYQDLINSNQENLNTLVRLLPTLRDYTRIPDVKLTAGQVKALSMLEAWMKTREPYFVLRGYAGTGKTYVLSQFAKTVEPEQSLYTAPTNKATKVLRTVLPRYRCKTIYSTLSLRMVEREDELILEASEEKFNLNGYRVIVVDESSMLNSELMAYIADANRRFGIKFLFVCDLCQLPPVGEDISPVAELKCPTIELTEVVRHDNQILDVATHVRNAILSGTRVKPIVFDGFSERSVWRLSPQGFYERCQKFAARGYKDTKIIAWRNRRVDDLNTVVREVLYTDEQRRFGTWLENDQIVLTEPVGTGKRAVATTDDEGIITETTISRDPETDLLCYFLGIKMEMGNTINIRAIHEDSEHRFQAQLSEFAAEARKPGNGKVWQKFWGLKNRYIGLRHSYALTAHRAQGSTFQNVLVDAGDILANPDKETAKRCLYVGLTRASHKLFLTGFPK